MEHPTRNGKIIEIYLIQFLLMRLQNNVFNVRTSHYFGNEYWRTFPKRRAEFSRIKIIKKSHTTWTLSIKI